MATALQDGMPVDARDAHGNTLLIVAAQNNGKRVVKLCLRHGADISATNSRGNTALHFAHAYGFLELASWLKSKGASVVQPNARGFCAGDPNVAL